MRLARKSIWIPCLLGALALAMLVFAWRFPKRATLAEFREAEAQRLESEALERTRAANAARDAILRPIHAAIERGDDSGWSGEYVVRKSLAESWTLVIGADSYAWLWSTDVWFDVGALPAFWPREMIRELGTFSVEGSVIHLRPNATPDAQMPHDFECRRDDSGRHVRVVGDWRWIDAYAKH